MKVGRALDRRILGPVLPRCHAVIVDAGRAGPEFAERDVLQPQSGLQRTTS